MDILLSIYIFGRLFCIDLLSPIFGGNWNNGVKSGSRGSNWNNSGLNLNDDQSVRGSVVTGEVSVEPYLSAEKVFHPISN